MLHNIVVLKYKQREFTKKKEVNFKWNKANIAIPFYTIILYVLEFLKKKPVPPSVMYDFFYVCKA